MVTHICQMCSQPGSNIFYECGTLVAAAGCRDLSTCSFVKLPHNAWVEGCRIG